MARLGYNVFSGIRPIEKDLARRLLGDNEAQTAHNCDLDAGTLKAALEAVEAASLDDDDRISIYKAADGWLSWTTDVDVAKSPISLDSYERIYFTGSGVPKVRGLLDGVYTTYDLGVPRPTAAPRLTIAPLEYAPIERDWHSFYEEPDGTQVDAQDHTEGTGLDIVETVPGKTFVMASVPARVTATAVARFVLWSQWYRRSDTGTRVYIGALYPQSSDAALNSDAYVQGSKLKATQRNLSGSATVEVTYTRDGTTNYIGERSYVYTFVDVFGAEGPPSPPTDVVPVDPAQQVNVYAMENSVSGNRNIVAKRIYRTVNGDAGSDFQFIKEIPMADTAYGDNVVDEDADEVLKTTLWYPPPENLSGILSMPGAFLVGFTGRTIHMSEVNQPHAWPAAYDTVVKDDIVGISVSDNVIFVATTGLPVIITAPDPQNVSVYTIPAPQPCRSKRSMLQWGGAIFYASDDGIVQAQGTTAVVITDQYIDKATWQSWNPETMIFAAYDNRILVFSDNVTLHITLGAEGMVIVTRDERVQAVYSDTANDVLYVVIGDAIHSWDTGDAKAITWKGKEWVFNRPIEFGCARVRAASYPVTLKLYANNELVLTRVLSDDKKTRLAKVRPEMFWAIQVESPGHEVAEVAIATSMEEL